MLDFVSIDAEGAELMVLQGLGLGSARCIPALVLEHNHQEPRRSDMREMLEALGYTYAGMEAWDDYYSNGCTGMALVS